MHTISIDDAVMEALEAQVSGFGQTANDVLRRLLRLDATLVVQKFAKEAPNPVLKLLETPTFLALSEAEERYLAILSTLYGQDNVQFARLESYGKGKRVYFAKSPKEIKAAAPYAGAKPVPESPYFALTTLDNAAKRKVLQNAMTIFGYPTSTTSKAIATIPSHARSGMNAAK